MKLSRNTILVAAALAAVTIFFIFLSPSWHDSAPPDAAVEQPLGSAQQQAASQQDMAAALDLDEASMSAEQREQYALEAMQQLLADAQLQPGNLFQTLRQMESQCVDPAECERLIEDALASYSDQNFATLVRNALDRLPLYESAMQQTVMSTDTPPRERYAAIEALRNELLGEQEAEALFGQESAWAEYQFRYGEMMTDPALASLPADARLQALEQLRNESFGDYANPLAEVEGAHGRYERELEVLTHGLEDSAQKAQITEQLRITHFGEETAQQMAERDQVVAEQERVLQAYNNAVSELDASMEPLKAQMDEARWNQLYEQQLREIRLQHFP